jgi:hypothetical protein
VHSQEQIHASVEAAGRSPSRSSRFGRRMSMATVLILASSRSRCSRSMKRERSSDRGVAPSGWGCQHHRHRGRRYHRQTR